MKPRRKLSPLVKLKIRLHYFFSDDSMERIATRFGTTHASVSRNTVLIGFARGMPLPEFIANLWKRWQQETRNTVRFTLQDFDLIKDLAIVDVLGAKKELRALVGARIEAQRTSRTAET